MPEGDSVFRLARRLEPVLAGQRLLRGELRVPQHATADLAERDVLALDTHGKHLLMQLSGDLTLHTHLKMTGSWTVTHDGRRLPPRLYPSVRVLLATARGDTAHGLDLPVVQLLRTRDEAQVVGDLGPDPLRPDWDATAAAVRMSADGERPLVEALLDQRLMAGLGNLWANELCFLRGHSPWTPMNDVDVERLVDLAARALQRSATVPGAYQVTTGDPRRGRSHWVAGRAHRPCLRCSTPVRVVAEGRLGPQSRRTWWCPSCQPGPVPAAVAA